MAEKDDGRDSAVGKYLSLLEREAQVAASSPPSSLASTTSATTTFTAATAKMSCTLYGRVERCVINEETGEREVPLMLTYRPHKYEHVPDVPTSFLLSSEALLALAQCDTIEEVLRDVVSLEEQTINDRLRLIEQGKLDHMLIVFSPEEVMRDVGAPFVLGDIDGLLVLTHHLHPEAAKRLQAVCGNFRSIVGSEDVFFQRRIDMLPEHEWRRLDRAKSCMWLRHFPNDKNHAYPSCGCEHYSFDLYCDKFDAAAAAGGVGDSGGESIHECVLETRRMLFMMFGCNKYYGKIHCHIHTHTYTHTHAYVYAHTHTTYTTTISTTHNNN